MTAMQTQAEARHQGQVLWEVIKNKLSWLGSSVGWSIDPVHQGFGFNPQAGHTQASSQFRSPSLSGKTMLLAAICSSDCEHRVRERQAHTHPELGGHSDADRASPAPGTGGAVGDGWGWPQHGHTGFLLTDISVVSKYPL